MKIFSPSHSLKVKTNMDAFCVSKVGSLVLIFSSLSSFFSAYADSSTPKKLNLELAMKLAEQKSFPARISEQNYKEAEAKYSQSFGNLFPKIDLDAKRVWLDKGVNKGVGILPQAPERITTLGLSVAQPIIGLAPLFLLQRINLNNKETAKEDLRVAKYEARFTGAENYVRAVRAEEGLKIAKSSLISVEKQKKDADALNNAGRLNQADLLRFELAVADANLQLSQAKTAFEISLAVLSESIGIPDDSIEFESGALSLWEQNKLSIPQIENALADAKALRPDLKSADNRIESAKYYSLASQLDYLPSLNAFANYERDFESKNVDIIPRYLTNASLVPGVKRKTLEAKDIRDKFSFGLQLKWIVWDWNTRWNRTQEFAALEQKAEIGREAAETGLKLEVTRSLKELNSASFLLNASKTAVKLAEEVYRLTEVRFKNAQVSSADLISSERDQTRARANFSNARGEADLAWLRFQKVTGKQPTTIY